MDSNENSNDQTRRLDLLLDVPLDIAVELGRARMSRATSWSTTDWSRAARPWS